MNHHVHLCVENQASRRLKRRTDGRMDGQTNCKKKKITVKILAKIFNDCDYKIYSSTAYYNI